MQFFRKPQEDLGNPLYNLRVKVLMFPVTYSVVDSNINDLFSMGSLAEIANFALQNLHGLNVVTDLGFILRLYRIDSEMGQVWTRPEFKKDPRYQDARKLLSGLPTLDAALVINENEPAMHMLIGAVRGGYDYEETETEVKLRYQYTDQNLYVKNGRLWVPLYSQTPMKELESALASSK